MAENASAGDPSVEETKRPQFVFGTRNLSDIIYEDYDDTKFRKKPALQEGVGRMLINSKDIWKHNAWDNVEWGEKQVQEAEEKLKKNSSTFLQEEDAAKYEIEANKFWDSFYSTHENKFFKDRHWLFTELPELSGDNSLVNSCDELSSEKEFLGSSASFRILEVGCGTGSTVFPLLEANTLMKSFIYCCDFSSKAVDLVKTNPNYDPSRCLAFECDVSSEAIKFPFPENSLDIILLIFVLSAITPEKFSSTIKQLSRHLKPGGRIFFRDYGRYDMAELRFKPGKCISEHFYVRGDGTRVYFFSQEELRALFEESGLVEEQNVADRRLLVNRGRQLTMYRVWIQCKYRRPV